jgi:phage gpG-like protein
MGLILRSILSAVEMRRKIQQRKKAMDNWRKPLKQIAQVLNRAVILNFRTQGSRLPTGAWKPLSRVTLDLRRKGKGSGSPRILQDSGSLYGSITPYSDDKQAAATTQIPYAAAQNFGRSRMSAVVPEHTRILRPKQKRYKGNATLGTEVTVKAHKTTLPAIPARPFMATNAEDKKIITAIGLNVLKGKYDVP